MTFLLWVAPTPRLWAGSSFHPHGSFPPVEHLGLLLEAPVWASLMDGLRSPTKKAPSLPPFPLPPFLHLCTFVHSASVLRHDSNGSAASKETFCFIVFLKCVRTTTARTTPFLYWLKTFATQHTTSSQKNQPASPEGGGGLGQKESAQSCRDFSSRYTWIHLDWQMIYRVHSMFLSKECFFTHTYTQQSALVRSFLCWSYVTFFLPMTCDLPSFLSIRLQREGWWCELKEGGSTTSFSQSK